MSPANLKSNSDASSHYSDNDNVHVNVVKSARHGKKIVAIPSRKHSEQESELDHIAVLGYD